ncbi:glycerophosphodiester phosphodiesterase [Paenimyroides aestuarii]|uniref:Glycerophosphodiester phosphodiesterase n=1 Tax=Paenimyroides aestuarii TaxID=2968490 RepID=A0ABY5NR48_9FLAO|nr:glycerophosphodiester phosphodiesterase family protein [Paenimyroides aestuarii]UUV21046.1 glycerophosphodiester phosphodiesterase [Paenimyroides aestuarii]
MKNKVIAHRGAWKEFNLPQNSIASLQKAIELQCIGSEIDVHLTKDDFIVVNHDHDFYGLPIENTNYSDLLSKTHPNGEKLTLLVEFFKQINNQNTTKLIVEIKTSQISPKRTQKLIDILTEQIPLKTTVQNTEFILFDFAAAIYLKKQLPLFHVHYLEGDKTAQQIFESGLNGMDYPFDLLLKNPEIIREFKKMYLQTNTWTVNNLEVAHQLIAQGIDFITTDYPQFFMRNDGMH